MTDSGLTRRLRQQSHRSGLAVGLSMALAIVVCFGGFTWLYVELDPWVRDFAGVEPAPTSTPRDSASADDEDQGQDEDENPPEDEEEEEPRPTRTPVPDDEPENEPEDIEEDDGGFDPDFQVIALEPVRLRSGPGVNFDIVVDGVPPGTPLEFLGNREPSANPDADGDIEWLNFRLEDGREGWIRQIDVSET
jgi:hypothetical protein